MSKKQLTSNKIIRTTIVFSLFLVSCQVVYAAIFFSESPTTFGVGGEIKMDVFIDSEGEMINGVEGRIVIPSNISVKDILYGSSLVTLWVDRPEVIDSAIIFSGVSPGGVMTRRGYLFTLVLVGNREGGVNFPGSRGVVYLHDGAGTLKTARLNFSPISISASLEKSAVLFTDRIPPETFSPIIATSTDVFNGKYFVVFGAQDKESGIAKYEVQETLKRKPDSTLWEETISPYELLDQTLSSYIFVRAIDARGNERMAKISPRNTQIPYGRTALYAILFIVFIALLLRLRDRHTQSVRK